jgi:putative ABC transport system permease protein
MWHRLLALSLAEWRHHPWRHGVALLAVALGVALASSVQLINASALAEFAQAVRSVNGQPDLVIAARERRGFDDSLLDRLLVDPEVAAASPVVEIDTEARRDAGAPVALRLLGIDALAVAPVVPDLMPRPASAAKGRLQVLDPDAVFLNPAALQRLGAAVGDAIELQSASGWRRFGVAGTVPAGGTALAVIDIAAAQAKFGRAGRLSRIDLRLVAGVDPTRWRESWQRAGALPADARWGAADDAVERVANLSRAYRVNLGVLALVALLVGAFLVYSVVSLSVAQRTPAFALLGVLGLAAADRRKLVLAESAIVGAAGSAVGLAAGTGLAALALRVLGGDLGGGYFSSGVAPALTWPPWPMAACAALGTAAAVAGAWWPARAAERLAPAQALKGLSAGAATAAAPAWVPAALLASGALLALLPPVAGLPLAAYAGVGLLLAGGVAAVPAVVGALLARQGAPTRPLLLLALCHARHARQTASATVAGVVASLALSVALTVMVASFRGAVADWLDTVLPADLYARAAGGAAASDQSALPPGLAAAAAALPGVARVGATRWVPMTIDPRQPPVVLIARPLGADPARTLPLVGPLRPAAPGEVGVYVSESAAALYGWHPGATIGLPLPGLQGPLRVRGVWRDYARQFGAVAIDAADYRRLTGDLRVNDLALWLAPGASPAAVSAALVAAAGPDHPLDLSSAAELRRISFAIFDRSFAVTRYLQAVAIGVGLVGVAASLSAQVLARRKQFGLLVHLGLPRRQVLALVTAETGVWLVAGTLIGLVLGIAVALVLVFVVNPQSFHWTMPLRVPAGPLAALAAAVLGCGALAAWFSARRAAGASAVMAVKEDW